VNKLNGNQILILSKNLNDFIKYVDDNHNNINDYILMSSFNNLQKDYNITQQQEKNKEIIRDNQQETGEILQESIPADGLEADKGPAEEQEDRAPPKDGNEIKKIIHFLDRTIFKLTGIRSFTKPDIQRKRLSSFFSNLMKIIIYLYQAKKLKTLIKT
jgi:hypothetical protein